jgi:uncharacterized protein involved in type VI secretion and phage assembly
MATNTRESGQNRPGAGYVTHLEVGIVEDNVDPEELGRIKVSFPTQPGTAQSTWIRLANPMAGTERGFYAVPEKQDEVVVGFMQGSPRDAVVLGAFWNGPEKPPPEAKDGLPGPAKTDTGAEWSTEQFTDGSKDLSGNDRRLWKSRSGHLFVFDDTSGAETVQIWDKEHNLSIVLDAVKKLITIANTQGDLHIRTKNDLYLEAGNDIKLKAKMNLTAETGQNTTWTAKQNVSWESSMSTKHKSGTDFAIEAGTTLSAKATSDASFEGLNLTAKGKMQATLEGGATASVTAAMVKIN